MVAHDDLPYACAKNKEKEGGNDNDDESGDI